MAKAEFNIWEGIYSTFGETRGDKSAFEKDYWIEKIVDRSRIAIEALHSAGEISSAAITTDYALPFLAATLAREDRQIRILDFGGGMGTSYVSLRAMLPQSQRIKFVVIENEHICERGRELFAGTQELEFRTELPMAPDQFDIINCGSSVHYVDEWEKLLRNFRSLSSDYLLFADVPAADNETFVTVQNYYGRRIPVHFWKASDFVQGVEQAGFACLFKSRYRGYYLDPGAEMPTSNFPDRYRLMYTSQFIFRASVGRHK